MELATKIFITYFVMQFYNCLFGQNPILYLFKQHNQDSKKVKSMTFELKKFVITINSFDLKTKIDTQIFYEKYSCIKKKGHISYLKEIYQNEELYGSYLYYKDSIIYFIKSDMVKKLDFNNVKYYEFENSILLFNYEEDTFYFSRNDSITLKDSVTITVYSKINDENGPGFVEQIYKFDANSGFLKSKETYYNQEFVLPKIYVYIFYENHNSNRNIPKSIKNKIKQSYNKVIKNAN